MKLRFVFAAAAVCAAMTLPVATFAQNRGHGPHGAREHDGGGRNGGGNVGSPAGGQTGGQSGGPSGGYGGGQGGGMGGGYSGGPHYGSPSYGHGGNYYGAGRYYGPHHYYGYPYYRYGYYYPYRPYYSGLAFGLYFASLPIYYDTLYWHGAPYYYADGTYYLYNDNVRKYETVAPPGDSNDPPSEIASSATLFVYPKDGQSDETQRTDRFECHQWAAKETGFDPTNLDATKSLAAAAPNKQADYRRAEIACLTGRGYSVK